MANSTKTASRLYETRIDLPEAARVKLIELLNEGVSDSLDLWSQIKQAHWNVKGPDFIQLHELFDEIAAEVYEYIDMLAERVTALGGYARGTVRIAAAQSALPEYPLEAVTGKEHLNAVADRLAKYGKHIRHAIDKSAELQDAGTADLYTEISRAIDKRLWFIEAHLQG